MQSCGLHLTYNQFGLSWNLSVNSLFIKQWSFISFKICLQTMLYEWLRYIMIVCVHTGHLQFQSNWLVCFCINLYDSVIGVLERAGGVPALFRGPSWWYELIKFAYLWVAFSNFFSVIWNNDFQLELSSSLNSYFMSQYRLFHVMANKYLLS